MDMEDRFKLRISSMFRSSFGSCRSKHINDVVEKPVFLPQNRQHYQLMELFSPKPRPFPSICRPKWPGNLHTEPSCIANKTLFSKCKISDHHHPLRVPADIGGRKCPPVSPISPFSAYHALHECETKPRQKRSSRKAMSKKTRSRNISCEFDDFPGCNYNGLFSSDEEEDDDKTTFFSSRSLSSDNSSESFRRNNNVRSNHISGKPRRRKAAKKEPEGGLMPVQGRVKGSFAVVKRSSDPYNDFRTSMVEMIVERQIFAANDLENMLQCFLSLNSHHHHRAIIEVFTEIWEALFSNWS